MIPDGMARAEAWMARDLASRIRPEHEREVNAAMPIGGAAALLHGFETASACYAGIRDGEILFLAGVGKPGFLTRSAVGWLLGSDAMDRHGVWIADASRRMLPVLHRESGARRIENLVPAGYRRALKWLTWLGFELRPPEPNLWGVPHVRVVHDMEI